MGGNKGWLYKTYYIFFISLTLISIRYFWSYLEKYFEIVKMTAGGCEF